MLIENISEYDNAQELRRRLEVTLECARQKLTASEFAAFSPQLRRKINEIDEARREYQSTHGSHPNTIFTQYAAYRCPATVVLPQQPAILFNSASDLGILVGLPGAGKPAQYRLRWEAR